MKYPLCYRVIWTHLFPTGTPTEELFHLFSVTSSTLFELAIDEIHLPGILSAEGQREKKRGNESHPHAVSKDTMQSIREIKPERLVTFLDK